MTEMTQAWREAVERSCQAMNLPQDQINLIRSSLLMRPTRKPTDFATVANSVARSVAELSALIQSHQKGYLASSVYSAKEKDELEAEVGRFVKTCAAQIERLKQSVLAAQQQRQLNGQAAAHMHGMVLILAESLQRTAAVFDGYRVQRYRQLKQDEDRRRQLMRAPPAQSQSQPSDSARSWAPKSSEAESSFTGTRLQQQTLAQENKNLVVHLSRTENLVTGIEKSVLEVATLSQLFSAAISGQASAIETIYENALQATEFVKAGNIELGHTIKVNRSTQYYIVVLLLVATLCLLFFDWLNS